MIYYEKVERILEHITDIPFSHNGSIYLNSFSNFRRQFILNILRELRASRGKESDRHPRVRKLEGRIPAVQPMRPAILVRPSCLPFP